MKVGFESIVKHTPKEVIPKSRFSYLQPALEALPEKAREAFSVVPEEIRRYQGRPGDRAEMMAVDIAIEAIEAAGISPKEIDFVVGAAVSLHREIGLRADVQMSNIANCCASFVDAVEIAWSLVESGQAKRVLVVASVALSGGKDGGTTDLTDPVAPTFGDGAAAAIVSAQNLKCEFLSYYSETDGRSYRSARGDIAMPKNPELVEAAGTVEGPGPYFTMEDMSYVDIAAAPGYLGRTAKKTMHKAGLELSDLDVLICHHLGDCESAWRQDLADEGLDPAVFQNLRLKYGNTGHTDLPTDLVHFVNEGIVKPGSVVVLWVPGSGISLGSLALRWLGENQ